MNEVSSVEGKAGNLKLAGDHDRLLVARISHGDREAFAELFNRLAPVVLDYLNFILRDQSRTEEILQEVFLCVWERSDLYRPDVGTPCGWILVMARSRALDSLRREVTRSRREAAFQSEAPAVEPVGTSQLELRQLRRRVREALSRLSPEQRACLALAYEEELSHGEISRRLAMPLGSVKSRLRLGIRKLGQTIVLDKAPCSLSELLSAGSASSRSEISPTGSTRLGTISGAAPQRMPAPSSISFLRSTAARESSPRELSDDAGPGDEAGTPS